MRSSDARGAGVNVVGGLAMSLLVWGCAGSAGPSDGVAGNSVGTSPEPGTLSLRLNWDPSVFNEDGSTAVDLAGYRIYDGRTSGVYTQVTDVGDLTDVVIDDFAPGTYYIAVTAYDVYGNESAFSNEVTVSLSES